MESKCQALIYYFWKKKEKMNGNCDQIESFHAHNFGAMSPQNHFQQETRRSSSPPASAEFYDKRRSRLDVSAYEPIQTIGSGSFGKIVKIRRKCDHAKLVWKELEVSFV